MTQQEPLSALGMEHFMALNKFTNRTISILRVDSTSNTSANEYTKEPVLYKQNPQAKQNSLTKPLDLFDKNYQ